MPVDLDARIRGLVMEIVEHAPPAPELDLAPEPTAPPRRRSLALAVVGIVIVVALIASALVFVARDDTTITPSRPFNGTVRIPLDSIPEGVSTRRLEGLPVFLVRRGDALTVLVAYAQHLPGEEVWWCPHDNWFESPAHGERFDANGQKLGGPARAALDSPFTQVRRDTALVSTERFVRVTAPPLAPSRATAFPCKNHLAAPKPGATVSMPLDSIPDGVAPMNVGGKPAFLVRAGRDLTVFVTNANHLKGETTLWWCDDQSVFYSPFHGETFDRDGRIVGGPARRALDRFRTTVRAGLVTVNRDRIIRGSSVRPLDGGQRASPCDNPLVSGP